MKYTVDEFTFAFKRFLYILTGFLAFIVFLSSGDFEFTDTTSGDYCHEGLFIYGTFIAFLPPGIVGLGFVICIVITISERFCNFKIN